MIRKIDPINGIVTILCGSTTSGYNDGAATSAKFYGPTDISINSATGIIFICDGSNHLIRQLNPVTSIVTTLAGKPLVLGSIDGIGTFATFDPIGLSVNSLDGMLYIACQTTHNIRKINTVTGT